MAAGDIINGYQLTTDWKVVGGMSEVAFATKDGTEWFIKKFISPKYPTDDSPGSERIKAQKRKNCEEFELRQRTLNGKIGSKCGLGGNLIYAYDFFRCGTCYYKINEKIDVSSVSVKDICKLDKKDLLIILRSLVHSLRIMHKEKIVHGDLKPDNILIKITKTGAYTTKLIDFDDSYFSGNPPKDREMVVGTPEYYSPELFDYISDEDEELSGEILTLKSDIFALGVIFTEYITGEKPITPKDYSATYSAVKSGASITFKKSPCLTPTLEALLRDMLQLEPSKRPSIDEVFERLRKIGDGSDSVPTLEPQIITFCATPNKVKKGENVVIKWEVINAEEVRIDAINGGLRTVKSGSKEVIAKPTFTITAKNNAGIEKSQTIKVDIETEDKTPTHGGSKLRGAGLDIAKSKK